VAVVSKDLTDPVDFSKLEQYLKQAKGEDECQEMVEKLKKFVNRLDLQNTKGIQRIAFVSEYFTQLSLEQAYRLIDPDGFRDEYEDTLIYNQSRSKILSYLQALLGLAPLIWTWYSLSVASNAYQQVSQRSESFLSLWQHGFYGLTWLTFTTTATVDAVLLASFLIVRLITIKIEHISRNKALLFARELREITADLMKVIRDAGISPITSDSDIQRVVDAFKVIVEDLFRDSQNVVKDAREAITNSNQKMQTLLDSYIYQVIHHFNIVVEASKELAATSQILAANSTVFANAHNLRISVDPNLVNSIRILNSTMQNMNEDFKEAIKDIQDDFEIVNSTSKIMNLSTQEIQKVGEQLAINGLDVGFIISSIAEFTREVQKVGEQLKAINNLDIESIVKQASLASDALSQVEIRLAKTTLSIKDVTNTLSVGASNRPLSKIRKIFGVRDK